MKMSFHGKIWEYVRHKFRTKKKTYGICDHPSTQVRRIKVDKGLKGRIELDTNIHEMLHACCWNLSEECVNTTASDIAKALWDLGYRKTINENEKRKEKNK